MTGPLRIGFVPIARPTFDTALAVEATAQARQLLRGKGWQLSGPEEMVMDATAARAAAAGLKDDPPDILLLFQATFSDSTVSMALAEVVDAPLLLWALPDQASRYIHEPDAACRDNLQPVAC